MFSWLNGIFDKVSFDVLTFDVFCVSPILRFMTCCKNSKKSSERSWKNLSKLDKSTKKHSLTYDYLRLVTPLLFIRVSIGFWSQTNAPLIPKEKCRIVFLDSFNSCCRKKGFGKFSLFTCTWKDVIFRWKANKTAKPTAFAGDIKVLRNYFSVLVFEKKLFSNENNMKEPTFIFYVVNIFSPDNHFPNCGNWK